MNKYVFHLCNILQEKPGTPGGKLARAPTPTGGTARGAYGFPAYAAYRAAAPAPPHALHYDHHRTNGIAPAKPSVYLTYCTAHT